MLTPVHWNKRFAFASALALFTLIAVVDAQQQTAQPPAAQTPAGAPAGRGGRGGGGGRVSRFIVYPNDAVERGLPLYNSTCGYCHGGERSKGGKGGAPI